MTEDTELPLMYFSYYFLVEYISSCDKKKENHSSLTLLATDYSYIIASPDVTNKVSYKNETRSVGFLYRFLKM